MENKETKSSTDFKTITNDKINYLYNSEKTQKRNPFFPFLGGMLGGALVISICLGIPNIKENIFKNDNSNFSTIPGNTGYVTVQKLSDYSDSAIFAANKALPSIVGIEVEYTVQANAGLLFSTPASSNATATGSGIIISKDGYILTNNHIVATADDSYYSVSEANKITVKLFNDDTEYEGKIIGKDEETDLAVIKIDKNNLTTAEFANSDDLKVGEFAMAVGNPLGMDSSITCGVISAVNRTIDDVDGKSFTLIQTDAAINSGNSGGALVNSEGKVIGINTLKLSGTGIEGMGFAIPINSTVNITKDLIEFNKVKRPYIGIGGIDLDEKTAKENKLVEGVYIKTIDNFSAAEKAQLKVGDVIVKVNNKNIKTMDELNEIKNTFSIGDKLTLLVNREGKEKEIIVTLGEQP